MNTSDKYLQLEVEITSKVYCFNDDCLCKTIYVQKALTGANGIILLQKTHKNMLTLTTDVFLCQNVEIPDFQAKV